MTPVGGGVRAEIQALRAVAVLLVLVYHVWPEWLPGGYVGVDVFFVISGYLITRLLTGELQRSGRLSFTTFYARRARRLLPAAFVTLSLVAIVSFFAALETRWRDTSAEVAASAVYAENWWLAARAVNYLDLDSPATPVEHFWSLAIEEQFYLAWPLVLSVLFRLARPLAAARERFRRVGTAFLVAAIAASFVYGVQRGASEGGAYFSTFARVWQLSLGAVLAVVGVPARPRFATGAVLLGLAAIAVAAVTLSERTIYPGYAALLPTGGAALVLLAGRDHAASPWTRWLAARPLQYLGDISYSIYLWHWPIIVFAQRPLGDELGPATGALVLVVSIGLGALSARFIERPFRVERDRPQRRARVLALALAGTCVTLGLAWGLHRAAGPRHRAIALSPARYPGAAVMLPSAAPAPDGVPFAPALVDVEADVPDAYERDCVQTVTGTRPRACRYGSRDAAVRVALIGDSHATHWLPAFELIAAQSDLEVVLLTKSSCSFSLEPVYHKALKREYRECVDWSRNVLALLAEEHFDHVVIGQSPRRTMPGHEDSWRDSRAPLAAALADMLRRTAALGPRVHVLRATPWQPTDVADCAASEQPPFDACTGRAADLLHEDAEVLAARMAGAHLVDLNDLFCRGGACPAIIGNVFVYRDSHHVTASFMRTLAPTLRERIGL